MAEEDVTPEDVEMREIAAFEKALNNLEDFGNGPKRRVIHLGEADTETLEQIDARLVDLQEKSKEMARKERQDEETEKRIKQIVGLGSEFSEIDLEETIKSPDDAFAFIANQYLELENQNRLLKAARQKLDSAESARKEIDKQFTVGLEREVIVFFERLRRVSDSGKEERIKFYEGLLKRNLRNHYSEGFKIVEEEGASPRVTFTDIGVAVTFSAYFSEQRRRFDDELSMMYESICQELEERGLASEVLGEVESGNSNTKLVKRRMTEEVKNDLRGLGIETLIVKFIELQKEYERLKKEGPAVSAEAYQQEREAAQTEIDSLRDKMGSLENLVRTSSIMILQTLKSVGDYLREKNEVCDFGYEVPQDAKPEEYLKLVISGINRFSSRMENVVGRLVKSRSDHESLLESYDMLVEIAPTEHRRFKALFTNTTLLSNVFHGYFTKFQTEGFNELRGVSPKLMPTEELINLYLNLLGKGIELAEKEVQHYDAVKDVLVRRKELAESYNCESGKKLFIRLLKMGRYVKMLETEAALETRMAKYEGRDEDHGPEHDSYNELMISLSQVANARHDLIGLAQELDPSVKDENDALGLYREIKKEFVVLKEKQKNVPDGVVYNEVVEKFAVLSQLGQVFGVEIDSYAGLRDLLKREQEKYEACAMGYKLINRIMLGKQADNPKTAKNL